MPRLAAGSRAADAPEQPRPRGRRAPRGARRLRRHGQGRARLALLRRDRQDAADARRRRDAADPVRQARRRAADPRVGAARAAGQLEPGRRLGDVGRIPPPGGARTDDVRPDDRGLVDLHRHAGHPPGDLRDVRGDRRQAPQRLAGGHDHADRRARRDGRRAAARRHDGRRRGDLRRGRSVAHRAPPRDPLPRRRGARHRPRARARHVGHGPAQHRPARQLRRRLRESCCAAAPRSTS